MRHTISILVDNEFGVLSKVSSLFSGRGFNIESLCVAETLDPKVSRMTIVTTGDDQVIEQITKQLNKLINVITVTDFTKKEHVDRELVLVKVNYSAKDKARLEHLVDKYVGKIVQHRTDAAIIEAVGDQHQIKQLLDGLAEFGLKELVRTGRVAMAH